MVNENIQSELKTAHYLPLMFMINLHKYVTW